MPDGADEPYPREHQLHQASSDQRPPPAQAERQSSLGRPSAGNLESHELENILQTPAITTSHTFARPALPSHVNTQQFTIAGHPEQGFNIAPSPTTGQQQAQRQQSTRDPLALDFYWDAITDYSHFLSSYEPQGELLAELQNQPQAHDFSIPFPIPPSARPSQSPQATHTRIATSESPQPAVLPTRPTPPPMIQAGTKRKAGPESSAGSSVSAGYTGDVQPPSSKRVPASSQSPSPSVTTPGAGPSGQRPSRTRSQSATEASQVGAASRALEESAATQDSGSRKPPASEPGSSATGGRLQGTSKPRRIPEALGGGAGFVLPAGKVFPIQIGPELFRLSGASISSDAPSYFTHFFSDQLQSNRGVAGDLRTLYIDRDPVIFRDISLHLQGYHIKPRDGEHYVRLFADAQFYSLPRLTDQLFKSDIFIQIGHRNFSIPRELFSSPGDSPNYFSLGFAHFFTTPAEVFPGLDRSGLLRPPSILPPSVPTRSGDTFAELLKLLQGYPVDIRDETHRAELLRDARYFHLRGLEQRLLPVDVSFNLARDRSEIVIRLEDIRQSGISFLPDGHPAPSSSSPASSGPAAAAVTSSGSKPSTPAPGTPAAPPLPPPSPTPGTVLYARPFVDTQPSDLIIDISNPASESTALTLSPRNPAFARASFVSDTNARISNLFSVIAAKLSIPTTQPLGLMMLETGSGLTGQRASPALSGISDETVKVVIGGDTFVVLDGEEAELTTSGAETGSDVTMHGEGDGRAWRWRGGRVARSREWVVRRALWRVRVESVTGEEERERGKVEVRLQAVRIEAFTGERGRNKERGFLGG